MAINEEQSPPAESKARRAHISIVTENGFTIVRLCDAGASQIPGMGRYCFIVENPVGIEQEVIVEFSTAAVALIQSLRHIPLLPESSFWISCAERSLSTYLWEENHLPPEGRLLLEELCLDDLETARCWNSD